MKLIELFDPGYMVDGLNLSVTTADSSLKPDATDVDLEREPSPKGEGNRLSPLSITKELPEVDNAVGPLGNKIKDGSYKDGTPSEKLQLSDNEG